MTTLPGIIYNQLFVSLPYPISDFTGQTTIVTGSNTGLGLEAARHLVRLRADRVILAVRSTRKGEEARKSIEESTKCSGVVEVWELDLTNYESVKAFAERASRELTRIDCVIENAAVGSRGYSTASGNETSLTVNVISTFLLGLLLLPLLRKAAVTSNIQPRLSFVVSDVHGLTALPERHQPDIFAALNADKSSSGMRRRYGVTKLLGVLLTRELATRTGPATADGGVIINCVNPGFCVSDLGRNAPVWTRPLVYLLQLILARTTEVGARTHVHAASSSYDTHGQYLSNCRVESPSTFVCSPEGAETQRRVFDQLLVKLEQIEPGISKLVTQENPL